MVQSTRILRPAIFAAVVIMSSVCYLGFNRHFKTTILIAIIHERYVPYGSKCSKDTPVDIHYNRTNPVPGIWVNSEGTLHERISAFNDALGGFQQKCLTRYSLEELAIHTKIQTQIERSCLDQTAISWKHCQIIRT